MTMTNEASPPTATAYINFSLSFKLNETFLRNLKMPTLSEGQKQSCEGEISIEELKSVLNSFQNDKSPGNDGLPIEFYKTCWNLINESFMECVRESFECGEMSSSQRKAVINLIEKQGNDRTLIENWRPICLINVDAKIISKVIAVKVKNVLPNIICKIATPPNSVIVCSFN